MLGLSCELLRLLNTSRDSDSTTSLSSLFCCLTALLVKKFFLISQLPLVQLAAISSPIACDMGERLSPLHSLLWGRWREQEHSSRNLPVHPELRGPELDTAAEVWLHQCWVQGTGHWSCWPHYCWHRPGWHWPSCLMVRHCWQDLCLPLLTLTPLALAHQSSLFRALLPSSRSHSCPARCLLQTEGVLDPLILVIDKDMKQNWPQHCSLGNTACAWVLNGCSTIHQHSGLSHPDSF